MSRAKVHDNSNAVSLFPFIAVLLCTMGALIVVLVCVTRLSREQALEEVAAREAAAAKSPDESPPDDEEARRQLGEVTAYLARLGEIRTQALGQLRSDQSRLSHLEDHIRRLQEKLDSLRLAARELEAMEEEHYDDREQAERELARLTELIEERQQAIEELQNENASKRRSYAILPYKGPHGTRRQPLYIECRRDEVVLQPEGIRLTPDDFRPPIGPGNPLASALRAGREHTLRAALAAGTAAPPNPYPLILVRPDGIVAYYRVRDAIESWDSDFGYEFVDGDWDLKFPPANPQMAAVEFQAVETARARMRMLAAAAPRAFGTYRTAQGSFSLADESMEDRRDGDGFDGGPNSFGSMAGSEFGGETDGEFFVATTDERHGGTGGHGGDGSSEIAGAAAHGRTAGEVDVGSNAAGTDRHLQANAEVSERTGSGEAATGQAMDSPTPRGQPADGMAADRPTEGESVAAARGSSDGTPSADAAAGPSTMAAASSASRGSSFEAVRAVPDEANTPGSVAISSPSEPHSSPSPLVKSAKVRGKDWAIRGADPGAVAIRRTIQIIVRGDRLAIMPESNGSTERAVEGREIRMTGPTDQVVDELVAALQRHVEQWGMAGRGLYWRPVLQLNVGPDGETRADDLARLLKNSGIDLMSATVASQPEGEAASATR